MAIGESLKLFHMGIFAFVLATKNAFLEKKSLQHLAILSYPADRNKEDHTYCACDDSKIPYHIQHHSKT